MLTKDFWVEIMKKKGIVGIVLIVMLIAVTGLSGCVGPWAVKTLGWDHINDAGTAVRIWGQLTITESPDNWNEGFVWDTQFHQNWNDYQYKVWADNHYGLGLFSLDIQNLTRSTTYHYRAFAENLKAENLIKIGAEGTFIPGGPRVVTDNATNIGLTQATINGNLWNLGGAASCEVFFLYGTDQNVLDIPTTHENMTGTGLFNATLMGLTTNTTYFYKAVAKNDVDAWSGVILSVTPGQPVIVTRQPGEIGKNYAILKGELWSTSGTATCDVWFVYGDKSPNDLNRSTAPQTMNTTGPFQKRINNLSATTKYWYQAVGFNGIAMGRGVIYEFTTTPTDQPLTSGVLGTPYNPSAGSIQKDILQRLPIRYATFIEHHPQLLQKYPMLFRWLRHY